MVLAGGRCQRFAHTRHQRRDRSHRRAVESFGEVSSSSKRWCPTRVVTVLPGLRAPRRLGRIEADFWPSHVSVTQPALREALVREVFQVVPCGHSGHADGVGRLRGGQSARRRDQRLSDRPQRFAAHPLGQGQVTNAAQPMPYTVHIDLTKDLPGPWDALPELGIAFQRVTHLSKSERFEEVEPVSVGEVEVKQDDVDSSALTESLRLGGEVDDSGDFETGNALHVEPVCLGSYLVVLHHE